MQEDWRQVRIKDALTLPEGTEADLQEMKLGDLEGLAVKDIRELGFPASCTAKLYKLTCKSAPASATEEQEETEQQVEGQEEKPLAGNKRARDEGETEDGRTAGGEGGASRGGGKGEADATGQTNGANGSPSKDRRVKCGGNSEDAFEVRGLLSDHDCGTLIGKKGANIQKIRQQSDTFINILRNKNNARPSNGIPLDRIMKVKGTTNGVITALKLVAELLRLPSSKDKAKNAQNPQNNNADNPPAPFRLLIPQGHAGSIIGKGGAIVREMCKETKCKITVSPQPLPGSTEKLVSMTGSLEALSKAFPLIVPKLEAAEKALAASGTSVLLFDPSMAPPAPAPGQVPGRMQMPPLRMAGMVPPPHAWPPFPAAHPAPLPLGPGRGPMMPVTIPLPRGPAIEPPGRRMPPPPRPVAAAAAVPYGAPPTPARQPEPGVYGQQQSYQQEVYEWNGYNQPQPNRRGRPDGRDEPISEEKMSIPSNMVGAVIGKGGTIIREINAQSGCEVRVEPVHFADGNARIVTLKGTQSAIRSAIFMIRSCIDAGGAGAVGGGGGGGYYTQQDERTGQHAYPRY